MSSVTLDQTSIERLQNAGSRVQICDPSGKVIGVFRPAPRIYKQGEMPDISEEELQRRFESKSWITTEDLLRLLEQS